MPRDIYDQEGHAYYVTTSCFKRRRLLDDDMNKRIVIGILGDQLKKQEGICSGFIIMPDHVHTIIWFPAEDQLSHFIKQWKQKTSYRIKQVMNKYLNKYFAEIPKTDPVWQPGYYSFNVFTKSKLVEKLEYMHANPVRAKLVDRPELWKYGSARYYILNKSVGLPIEIPS